jgi:CRISPR system Cascade subunit CasA
MDGIRLLWLAPWDGKSSYSFATDPFFIEISRRVRLDCADCRIKALRTTSKGSRITKAEAYSLAGNTGDLWTPIHLAGGKALSVSGTGFNYRRIVELLFSADYQKPPSQIVRAEDGTNGLTILARAIAGGQSTTSGYHERRIPISLTVRKLMMEQKTDRLAKVAQERVHTVGQMRSALWTALAMLFDNGAQEEKFSDGAKDKANVFSKAFEQGEDARFFDELNTEMESDQPEETCLQWMLSMVERAETVLRDAFDAGPRSGEQRYRARAAALASFHGRLRSEKFLPTLAAYYRQHKVNHQQRANKEIPSNAAP